MSSAVPAPQSGQVKETLVSIIIAFILAFVFRAFVIEAFIIPTGSMALTLMGAHMRFRGENTGYEWPVGPQYVYDGTTDQPTPIQGGPGKPVIVHDPMSREEIQDARGVRRQAGDRILVFKYLYSIYDPRRFDVVVFKAPHAPQENYIKRLVGLPGEMIALIDGDLFVRKPAAGEPTVPNPWLLSGWQVQRKPERAQRAVWQDVFSSEFTPLGPVRSVVGNGSRPFHSPWLGAQPEWKIDGQLAGYRFDGAGPATLAWDNQVKSDTDQPYWPVSDFCFYNDTQNLNPQRHWFSVSDVNMRCGIEPSKGPVDVSAIVRARGHEFRADIRGTTVTLKMAPLGVLDGMAAAPAPTQWTDLATGTLPHAIAPGSVANLEFWHVDQSLSLWCDGKLVAHGEYDWTPAERVKNAFGEPIDEMLDKDVKNRSNTLTQPRNYRQPVIRWEFSGGPFTLYRVGLQRDIHYEASTMPGRSDLPARATYPTTTMTLSPDQFFVCGDNNPASLDARLWPEPDPWVQATIDKTEGVVPRNLMIGRAFFVYFPSMIKGSQSGLPVPDFGRLRWIW